MTVELAEPRLDSFNTSNVYVMKWCASENVTMCLDNYDGSRYVNWDEVRKAMSFEVTSDVTLRVIKSYAELLWAARDNFVEVSEKRAHEIAREYGAKFA